MSNARFRYFVMFAEMRTGSNFLEQNLNQFSGLCCYGELFNPHFVGKANKDALFGITLQQREHDPEHLIDTILSEGKNVLPGFRFFHDHDPRILKKCLEDRDCAKIILSRNPLDSYISRKIASETGQWKLTNVKHRKLTKIEFDAAEFETDQAKTSEFRARVIDALQVSGQTVFRIGYDDLQSLDVLNGLGAFLGVSERVTSLDKSLKKQNPATLRDKVSNYPDMMAALGALATTNLTHRPEYEPRRGASVPSIVAANRSPLVFLPIKGAPFDRICEWMAHHDNGSTSDLLRDFNQKTLRKWRRERPGFQSFTVLRHPLERAHHSFCEYIASDKHGSYRDLRQLLARTYKIKIPGNGISAERYDLRAHHDAFQLFLEFLKLNLSGQTSLHVDPAWCSQSAVIEGASKVMPLMHIIQEPTLETSLNHIGSLLKIEDIPLIPRSECAGRHPLSDIYSADMESVARQAYSRDYLNFGFEDWRG